MERTLQSLSKLFSARIFRIPDYQRGYAWKERHVRDFWSDIERLEENRNHYVGVITLEDVPAHVVDRWSTDSWLVKSRRFDPFYIVDGQQRLTTAILLIWSIIKALGRKKRATKICFQSVPEIVNDYIYTSKDGGLTRSYIFGYEIDNPSYEYLKREIFEEPSSSDFDIQETVYTQNLQAALKFFSSKLRRASVARLESLYDKVTQRLMFNTFRITSDIDVHITFETMNNRGKQLSTLELLKNRLIFLTMSIKGKREQKRR